LAIDQNSLWWLLFQGGNLSLLAPAGTVRALLDPEDGIPPTARRLLVHPQTGEVFEGSTEDLVIIEAKAARQ
jgi:hypothetical protein